MVRVRTTDLAVSTNWGSFVLCGRPRNKSPTIWTLDLGRLRMLTDQAGVLCETSNQPRGSHYRFKWRPEALPMAF